MLQALGVTIPGLEELLREEISDILGREAERIVPGKVEFLSSPEQLITLNYLSRSATRFLILLKKEILDPISLEEVKRVASEVDWPSYFRSTSSFAVRAERIGYHDFTSVDVAAAVGEAVVERFLTDTGVRIRANLKNPDVIVRAYVSGNKLILGLDTTGESLHKRGYRVFEHRTALNPIIAYALVRLSGWLNTVKGDSEVPLIDPMCGGGTIPIEAALAALKVPPGKWRKRYPVDHLIPFEDIDQGELLGELDVQEEDLNLRILCSDISPKSISGAIENAKSAGVLGKIAFSVRDASILSNLPRIGAVSTDPPYELRTGRNRRIEIIFRKMAKVLEEKLELRFSVICAGPALPKLVRAMRCLNLIYSRRILYGGIEARIMAYERR